MQLKSSPQPSQLSMQASMAASHSSWLSAEQFGSQSLTQASNLALIRSELQSLPSSPRHPTQPRPIANRTSRTRECRSISAVDIRLLPIGEGVKERGTMCDSSFQPIQRVLGEVKPRSDSSVSDAYASRLRLRARKFNAQHRNGAPQRSSGDVVENAARRPRCLRHFPRGTRLIR